MMKNALITAVLLCTANALPAYADTVVSAGGKPGVATAWKADGKAVVLTIQEGYSASEVAEAIIKSVPGAKATATEGQVKIEGVAEAELIAALERVEVGEELDDIDAAFAAARDTGDGDEGSGSSIRATKAATIPGHTPSMEVSGSVISVQHKRFPVVVITMKLSEGAGDLKKGAKVSFVPAIMAPGGIIASDDERSKKNVSAWYSRRGDRVKVSLGAKKKKYYSATRFERLR